MSSKRSVSLLRGLCSKWLVRVTTLLASMRLAAMLLASMLLATGSAHADETPLVVAGALLDSRAPTLAPVLALRMPVFESSTLVVSQVGWTSSLALTTQERPGLALRSSLELTPLAAHLSHDVYDEQGREQPQSELDDTALRATSGVLWSERPARVLLHAVLNKEWLSGADAATASAFRYAFMGLEAAITLEHLRSEEPLRARIDGVRLQLRAHALQGARSWSQVESSAELGRQHGPLFATLRASAFHSELDALPSTFTVGGSWDVLGARALVGHPLGAFRLTTGASGTAGLDLRIAEPFELGARASLLVGASQIHGGVALLAHGVASGLSWFAGAGSPGTALARGELSKVIAFAGVQGALFVL